MQVKSIISAHINYQNIQWEKYNSTSLKHNILCSSSPVVVCLVSLGEKPVKQGFSSPLQVSLNKYCGIFCVSSFPYVAKWLNSRLINTLISAFICINQAINIWIGKKFKDTEMLFLLKAGTIRVMMNVYFSKTMMNVKRGSSFVNIYFIKK